MLAFPDMLAGPAQEAGITVPENAEDFDKDKFPHFAVYLNVQLGSPLPYPTAHWDNAKVIAAIPEDKIRTVTISELIAAGLATGHSVL